MTASNKFVIKKLSSLDIHLFQELILVFETVFEMKNFKIPSQYHLQNLLRKPDFIVFVALDENKVVGGLTAYILTSYFVESSDVFVLDLAVKTEFQRKGLGKKLMDSTIEYCKSKNMNVRFVQADELDQHAVDFYHALGGIAIKAINFDYTLSKKEVKIVNVVTDKIEYKMPFVSEGLQEFIVLKLFVKEGDLVHASSPIIEVETDKATIEIPIDFDAKIIEWHVKLGDKLVVGTTICTLVRI